MSRTLTAMYDSRSEAETAREQLRSLGADARISDQSTSSGAVGGTSGGGGGFWAELKDVFVSDEDRSTYEEGVRRGGYLLTATVREDQADEAVAILNREGSVDLDQREQQWRGEGWAGYQGRSEATATGTAAQEEHIPIVEEQLRVGKREVTRGGARVRSYVEEVPVQENVTLRQEHVSVERRPVDQRLSSADLANQNLLRERTVEMRETGEEAVVGKEARIVEEVVVSKTATERTEQVQDTVRRTNVEVDRDGVDTGRGAFSDQDR